MTVADSARSERANFAGYRCEAAGLHHKDCPRAATPQNVHQFVLHHVIRRSDKHDPNYLHRDDVQHLRFLWNGPTGLGAAGCHGETHRNQDKARALGLLAERKLADVLSFRTRNIECVEVEDTRTGDISLIPVTMLDHLNKYARVLGTDGGGAA